MENLVSKIYHNVKPKCINSQPLTGSMMVRLIDEYVNCLNSDQIPTISTAWERVIEEELERALRMGVDNFKIYIEDRIQCRLPMEESDLLPILHKTKLNTEEEFAMRGINNMDANLILAYRAKLVNELAKLEHDLLAQNAQKSYVECEELFNTLYQQVNIQLNNSCTSVNAIITAWQKLREVIYIYIYINIVLHRKFHWTFKA